MTLYEFWMKQGAKLSVFEDKDSFNDMIREYMQIEPNKDIQNEMDALNEVYKRILAESGS